MIDQAVLDAANHSLGEFIAQEPDFYNTPENCRVLQAYLQNEQVPIEEWCHVNVWAATYWQCKRQGLLEQAPPPKSRAELEAEWNIRDREAGSRKGNQDLETPSEKVARLIKERQENRQTEAKRITDAAQVKVAAENAANDLSNVPSIEQFRAGEGLTQSQLAKLSAVQLRTYVRREAEAKRLNQAQRADKQRRPKENNG